MPPPRPHAARGRRPMTVIVVHDYSGHPGQAQLSRGAGPSGLRGAHQHCPPYATGKGSSQVEPGDPDEPALRAVCHGGRVRQVLGRSRRIRQELAYGRRAAAGPSSPRTRRWRSSATCRCWPTSVPGRRARSAGVPMVFWHQDIYSEAIGFTARRRLPVVGRTGRPGGGPPRAHDRPARARRSSPSRRRSWSGWRAGAWRTRRRSCPTGRPSTSSRCATTSTTGARGWGCTDGPVVLYSGTLGLKHDPSILAAARRRAAGVASRGAGLVVVSEGKGRDWLEDWKREQLG